MHPTAGRGGRPTLRLLCGILIFVLTAPVLSARVRELSDAEREAVQIAARYLSYGPSAVLDRLAPGSPLRTMPREMASVEVEARLGPYAGARWELETVVDALKDRQAVFAISYPSGVDEEAIFDLVRDGDQYKVQDITILGQRSPRRHPFADLASDSTATRSTDNTSHRNRALVLGFIAAILAAATPFLAPYRYFKVRLALSMSALFMIAALALVITDERLGVHRKTVPAPTVQSPTYLRLAHLVPLRRALAAGTGEFDSVYPQIGRVGDAGKVAELWKAQWDLQQMRVADVKQTLSRFPTTSNIPLVEILRGRLALFETDEVSAAVAYEQAVNLGPGRDGLWYETAQALSALGFEKRALGYMRRLSKIASRRSDVYYALATHEAGEGGESGEVASENYLRQAWALRPAQRADLVETPVLWSIIRRPAVATMITLAAPWEAVFASERASTRPISLTPEAKADVSGDYLRVTIGEAELRVPGGAALAPPGSVVVDAGAWNRADEEQALKDYTLLASVARSAGAFTQPALRARITRTANALARRNKWSELTQLTDGLDPKSEHVPADLFFARALALQRTNRLEEAKALLTNLARSRVLQRKRDATALYELGEMLSLYDLYDDAIKMLDRSQSIRNNPYIDERVRQIQMNKRLATKYSVHSTDHFDIHYPEDVSPNFANDIGRVLELEFKRLQQWIPTENFDRVTVNILWWSDFRSTYTGSDFILGFYLQKKITLPFAGVHSLDPMIVAILSHELAHAMLAQATNDQAPRWFQEGLAQRIEMRPYHSNAFNMYEDDRLLAVSLLDSVLSGSPDPAMITEAYIEAQTVIRFVEAKYGYGGVKKVIAAFRAGATTEEAFATLGMASVADFDEELRKWGRSASRVFDNPPPVIYNTDETTAISW